MVHIVNFFSFVVVQRISKVIGLKQNVRNAQNKQNVGDTWLFIGWFVLACGKLKTIIIFSIDCSAVIILVGRDWQIKWFHLSNKTESYSWSLTFYVMIDDLATRIYMTSENLQKLEYKFRNTWCAVRKRTATMPFISK